MSEDPLADLIVAYVANVGSSATDWLASRFKRSPNRTPHMDANALNLAVQSRLHEGGVPEREAREVAELLLRTTHLGYFLMLVRAARQGVEYAGFPAQEISAFFALELGLSSETANIAGEAIASALTLASESGDLSMEFSSAIEGETQLSPIQLFGSQKAKKRFIESATGVSLSSLNAFNEEYKSEIERRFGTLQLHHLDNGSEERLDRLYVDPRFKSMDWWHEGKGANINSDKLLPSSPRIVIIGPAGSGKSTAVRRLAATVSTADGDRMVPIAIELRKYLASLNLDTSTILEYVKQNIKVLMQQDVPQGWVEYLLITGRAVVFFDGLDEVLDAGTRSQVRDAILRFSQVFPAASIVVTSRPSGYESAPFLDTEWSHFEVQPLNKEQVKDYASRWFGLKSPGADVVGRTRSFIKESHKYAKDLRSNPLMLSLLCSVYYVSGEIPRTLSSLYDRCADLIYRQWNTMRGIEDHRAWDADVRPVLYWVASTVIQSKEYSSSGIPEEDLVSEIARASVSNGAPSMDVAISRARETVKLWAGRAWIVTSVSMDESGRPRYGFVHQSFLEYFAAVYSVRKAETPEELFELLRDRLVRQNGTSVAQIAVSIVQQWRENGAERFLGGLIRSLEGASGVEKLTLLRFAVSLDPIVAISQTQLRAITRGAIEVAASSIWLPSANEATYSANEFAEDLYFDWLDGPRSKVNGENTRTESRADNGVEVPTPVAEALLEQIARRSSASVGLRSATQASLQDCIRQGDAATLAACLVFIALLRKVRNWNRNDEEVLLESAEAFLGSHWVVTWMATQLGYVDLLDAMAVVPWHASLLNQRLVFTERAVFTGPVVFSGDIHRSLSAATGQQSLALVGRQFSRSLVGSYSAWYGVLNKHLKQDFVFQYPESSLQSLPHVDDWEAECIVGFAIVARIAGLSWPNAHAIGELVNESDRPILRQIAATAAGWGSVFDDEMLSDLPGPLRLTVKVIFSPSWPSGLVEL